MASPLRRSLVARRGFVRLLWGFIALGFFGGLGSNGAVTSVFAQDRLSLQSLETLLRSEKGRGLVILVRHAETVSGIGDPPGFRLEDCATQRNLSAQGRGQARRMGAWFISRGLVPTAVRSSQWCRCLDTAKEAFAQAVSITPWPALNSTFQGRGDAQAQQAEIQAHLMTRGRASAFEVWVTHQVLISALTGQYVSMGEMVVTRPDAQGRLQFVGRVISD
ncbi:MAG: histidine phosphatase family protein [Burkholderiaceae bacterium]|jgi:phosphohistidine phosphatase SixA